MIEVVEVDLGRSKTADHSKLSVFQTALSFWFSCLFSVTDTVIVCQDCGTVLYNLPELSTQMPSGNL